MLEEFMSGETGGHGDDSVVCVAGTGTLRKGSGAGAGIVRSA